ncbi:predicted protein [Lichtheimia corymbifera JMRC:FSU:9682]|uniref:Uncharacterized protein n=1 Tax=Lichtheimia corymbifera JMRC:FSU:9682 TaxID=1263082 RepID=A0A068S1U9_9FUNG|nr:predicted protein [Lichtheimia corymbifera JMRC:FSU:9682]
MFVDLNDIVTTLFMLNDNTCTPLWKMARGKYPAHALPLLVDPHTYTTTVAADVACTFLSLLLETHVPCIKRRGALTGAAHHHHIPGPTLNNSHFRCLESFVSSTVLHVVACAHDKTRPFIFSSFDPLH